MPVVTIDDRIVHYRLEGSGDETIVLVNGLADDLETWAFQMDDFLAAGYRVLRFDNRGVGGSAKPAGPYSSRMLADELECDVALGFHKADLAQAVVLAGIENGEIVVVTAGYTFVIPKPKFEPKVVSDWHQATEHLIVSDCPRQ